jgi:hypothetical protein
MMTNLMRATRSGLVLASTLSLFACGGVPADDATQPTTDVTAETGEAQQELQYGYVTYNQIGVWLRAAPCDTCSTIVWANAGTPFHVYDTRNNPGWTYGYFRLPDNSTPHGYIRNYSPSGTRVLADLHDCCDAP